MSKPSLADRAWGFTGAEYLAAFRLVTSREEAEAEVAALFDLLTNDSSANIGGDDHVFALLSLVSESARERVRRICKWNDNELKAQQETALRLFRKGSEGDER